MKAKVLAGACLATFMASQASAAVVNGFVDVGTGSFELLTMPITESSPDNTVGNNTFNDENLYALDELQGVTLGSSVDADIVMGGGSGTIASGTKVSSHYIFFDPVKTGGSQEGRVIFDTKILAVITSLPNLINSDFLGAPGVTYLSPLLRGLEPQQDTVWISGLKELSVDWSASSPGDYVRVLTASPVPLPGAVWLFMSGLAGVFGAARRKAKAAA